jgi:hypothetical protein
MEVRWRLHTNDNIRAAALSVARVPSIQQRECVTKLFLDSSPDPKALVLTLSLQNYIDSL